MTLQWRTTQKYQHCEVSNTGLVRYKDDYMKSAHVKTHRYRPLKLGGLGYLQVNIVGTDGVTRTESVHNLVAEAFHGTRPDDRYRVDHINSVLTDNTVDNLRWLLHGDNTCRGKHCGGRKYFYPGELWLIRRLISNKVPYVSIGKMFLCSSMVIYDINRGLKQGHLKTL